MPQRWNVYESVAACVSQGGNVDDSAVVCNKDGMWMTQQLYASKMECG